jgi:hypothetical protein
VSLKTRPLFYFIDPVTVTNQFLDFSEGGPEINGKLVVGARSPEQLMLEAARALNDQGALDYTVTLNRVTRIVTIAASGVFELKPVTGTNAGQSIFSVLGFTTDRSLAATYDSDLPVATEWRPQFFFKSYVDFDDFEEAVKASVQEAANGAIQTVSFGDRNFMMFEAMFITDGDMGTGNIIETQVDAVANVRTFLKFIRKKGNLEFMPDRDDPDTFFTVLHEKSADSSDGTGYRLHEMLGMGLADFYQTGMLTFRKVIT